MAGWILGCMLLYACWFFLCLARDKPKLIVKFFYWLAWIGAIGFGVWSGLQTSVWARELSGINTYNSGWFARGGPGHHLRMLGLHWFSFWLSFGFGCIGIIICRMLLNLYQDYEDEAKVKWVPPKFSKLGVRGWILFTLGAFIILTMMMFAMVPPYVMVIGILLVAIRQLKLIKPPKS